MARRQLAIEEAETNAALLVTESSSSDIANEDDVSDSQLAGLDGSPETVDKINLALSQDLQATVTKESDTGVAVISGHGNPENTVENDLNLVFGPGAAEMSLDIGAPSDISSDKPNEVITTFGAQEEQASGRVRSRGSGRSSINSPSPARPRLDPSLDPGGGSDMDSDKKGAGEGNGGIEGLENIKEGVDFSVQPPDLVTSDLALTKEAE